MRISVKVRPSSGRQSVTAGPDGSLVVHLRAAPEHGKANAELIVVLAAHFGVPRSSVAIVTGATGRTKIMEITDA